MSVVSDQLMFGIALDGIHNFHIFQVVDWRAGKKPLAIPGDAGIRAVPIRGGRQPGVAASCHSAYEVATENPERV